MVDAFEWFPDNSFIAYRADQNNLGEFELFTTPPTEQDPVKVSRTVSPNNGDVTKFSWSPSCPCNPSSLRIAYLSDQQEAGLFELFTNLPTGGDNVRISDGDSVQDFAWAPDLGQVNESLAYSTEVRIFTAPPNGGSNTPVTSAPPVGGIHIWFSAGRRTVRELLTGPTRTPSGSLSCLPSNRMATVIYEFPATLQTLVM